MKTNNCKIRLIEEKDIPILYEHLREFVETPNASTSGNLLPPYDQSKKFVMKYLIYNENHEYDKWYIVLDENENIVGNIFLSKKNMIAYHILKKYQRKGFAEASVKLMMKENPRKRFFAIVNMKNEPSLDFTTKLGFKKKSFIFEKIESDYE